MQVGAAAFLSSLVMLRHKRFASDPSAFIWFSPLCSVDCVLSSATATAATAGHDASSACEQHGWATDGASSPGKALGVLCIWQVKQNGADDHAPLYLAGGSARSTCRRAAASSSSGACASV